MQKRHELPFSSAGVGIKPSCVTQMLTYVTVVSYSVLACRPYRLVYGQ